VRAEKPSVWDMFSRSENSTRENASSTSSGLSSDLCFFPLSLHVSSYLCTVSCSCTFHLLSLILSCHRLEPGLIHFKHSRYSNMRQQPAQTGLLPIPGPPQHGLCPRMLYLTPHSQVILPTIGVGIPPSPRVWASR
jgi:hypothetical protein